MATNNPRTGEPVIDPERAAYAEQLLEIRRNARKAGRSGNPAKKYPGLAAAKHASRILSQVYRDDAAQAGA